jgi:hypothetical protein
MLEIFDVICSSVDHHFNMLSNIIHAIAINIHHKLISLCFLIKSLFNIANAINHHIIAVLDKVKAIAASHKIINIIFIIFLFFRRNNAVGKNAIKKYQ